MSMTTLTKAQREAIDRARQNPLGIIYADPRTVRALSAKGLVATVMTRFHTDEGPIFEPALREFHPKDDEDCQHAFKTFGSIKTGESWQQCFHCGRRQDDPSGNAPSRRDQPGAR